MSSGQVPNNDIRWPKWSTFSNEQEKKPTNLTKHQKQFKYSQIQKSKACQSAGKAPSTFLTCRLSFAIFLLLVLCLFLFFCLLLFSVSKQHLFVLLPPLLSFASLSACSFPEPNPGLLRCFDPESYAANFPESLKPVYNDGFVPALPESCKAPINSS